MSCKGGGLSELRIRFADVGPKKGKRRKSAPDRTASALKQFNKLRGRPGQFPADLVPHSPERLTKLGEAARNPTGPKDNSDPIFSALPEPLDDSGSSVAEGSILQAFPLNSTSLCRPLDTLPEVGLPVNHEDISTPYVASNAISSHSSSDTSVHRMVHEPSTADFKRPCLWPLAENEGQLVKHFFTALVSWVSK